MTVEDWLLMLNDAVSISSHMESGPKAPLVQRTKVVFDPNWNRVMWIEHGEAEDE